MRYVYLLDADNRVLSSGLKAEDAAHEADLIASMVHAGVSEQSLSGVSISNEFGDPCYVYDPAETDLGANIELRAESVLVPGGFSDVSDILNWDRYWTRSGKDYKYARAQIAAIANTNWTTLSAAEKEIAARWFAVDAAKRTETYTMQEQIELGRVFHERSVESRRARMKAAVSEVYNRLAFEEAKAIVNDVCATTNPLAQKYVDFGIEGTLEGDGEGLFDYLEARTGTAFTATGLAARTYVPNGMSLSAFVDRLVDILAGGNY